MFYMDYQWPIQLNKSHEWSHIQHMNGSSKSSETWEIKLPSIIKHVFFSSRKHNLYPHIDDDHLLISFLCNVSAAQDSSPCGGMEVGSGRVGANCDLYFGFILYWLVGIPARLLN